MYTTRENRYPGRFEGNISYLVARVVDEIVSNGFAAEEFGDAQETGYFALVEGKKYGFILYEDSNGFVHVTSHTLTESWDEFNKLRRDNLEVIPENSPFSVE